jgi:hypothetical protein
MGLFSKFKHRSDDEPSYEEVRSHVLGEELPPLGPSPQPMEPSAERFNNRYQRNYPEKFPERSPLDIGPSGMEMPFSREPIAIEQKDERTIFEILDRLSMIEAQLAAIRSQTETINERLKNIDARLPRRY